MHNLPGDDEQSYTTVPANMCVDPITISEFPGYLKKQSMLHFTELRKHFENFANNHSYQCLPGTGNDVDRTILIAGYFNDVRYALFEEANLKNVHNIWNTIFLEKYKAVIFVKHCDGSESSETKSFILGKSLKYDRLKVIVLESKIYADYEIHKTKVMYGKHVHELFCFQLASLPLKEYLVCPSSVINFYNSFKMLVGSQRESVIALLDVSGFHYDRVIIVVDQMLELSHHEGVVDIHNYVQNISKQVPTISFCFEQYLLIHNIVADYLMLNNTCISTKGFDMVYQKLKENNENEDGLFEKEFETLNDITKYKLDCAAAMKYSNLSKNRYLEVLASKLISVAIFDNSLLFLIRRSKFSSYVGYQHGPSLSLACNPDLSEYHATGRLNG